MVILAHTAAPLKGRRVLVADRHAQTRTALREMVNALGCTSVSHVQSAAEVLRCVKSREVDIVLCDYHLEDQRDGQQLLEEVRQNRLIAMGAIFMMITGESSYKKVVAVAEFAPDDYLIKPFTANQLLDRLVRVSRKKEAFARAYTFIEAGRAESALPECRAILSAHPEYAAETYRLMVDVLLGLKRLDEAEQLLQAILSRKDVPWARTGLANVYCARGDLRSAEQVLDKLAAAYPEYLGAQDFLARLKTDLDKPAEALAILEAAGAISCANVNRLRKTGDLAAATGDHEKCTRIYARVLERVRNSSMARAEDFMTLAKAYVQQDRMDEAEKVSVEQRRTMRGNPEAELVSRLMEYQRLAGGGESEKPRRNAAIDAAVKAFGELPAPVSAALELDYIEACFRAGRGEAATAAAERLLTREDDVAEVILRRAREAMANYRERQAVAPAIVPLDQLLGMLGSLNTQGWDDALGHACQVSITYWGNRSGDAGILAAARSRLAEVVRKYGMDAMAAERAVA